MGFAPVFGGARVQYRIYLWCHTPIVVNGSYESRHSGLLFIFLNVIVLLCIRCFTSSCLLLKQLTFDSFYIVLYFILSVE